MAVDPSSVLELLRNELRSTGYGGLIREDELASEGVDRDAAQVLDELLNRLQTGVVSAMLAHAASIRNLAPRPGPSGRLWEPPPSRSKVTAPSADRTDSDIAIGIDADDASRIEAQARELARLLNEMRDAGVDEG